MEDISENHKNNTNQIKEIHEKKEKRIEKRIISNEISQFSEKCKILYDFIQTGKGIIFIKNKDNNLNIKINNKSFCKIFQQASLINKLSNYIVRTIFDETTVEIGSSTEIYDDNEKMFQIIKSRNEFPVLLAEYMDLDNEERIKRQIMLKSKSINNILSKIGPLNETMTYIQISLTEISIDYDSTKILTHYVINRYNYLTDKKKTFHILYNTKEKEDEKNDDNEDKLKNCPISYYSIKKIMNMTENNPNQNDQYLSFGLINEENKILDDKNQLYLNKLTKGGENMDIYKKFKENEEINVKNILGQKVEIKRMKKTDNNEFDQIFNIFEEKLNIKKDKEIPQNNDKERNEKLKRIENKKKEIEEAINNRYNRFIEIMHNNKDKKYINLQYLDLMEDFNKKYGKYKIDYYSVKNDRFKDVLIPAECIDSYRRYKTEYEKKQFILINLNKSENEVQYLVNVNDLKKLYDEWTDLEKEQFINTENPQFEGKKIDLDKINIVKIGEMKELPEQPDLLKKMKEEEKNKKEKKDNEEPDKESMKIYEKYPEIYKNVNDKGNIRIRRIIKKKKKKENK